MRSEMLFFSYAFAQAIRAFMLPAVFPAHDHPPVHCPGPFRIILSSSISLFVHFYAQPILSVLHIECAASSRPAVLLSLPSHLRFFQPTSYGQEIGLQGKKSCDQKVSIRSSLWHGEERPGHSEECNYSFASLILPAHVVASLALPSVLGRFGLLRSSFGAS